MKSGSWSSFQSALPPEARAGGEPDDAQPPRTIPETPKVCERFMAVDTPHRWAVLDWFPVECRSCLGSGTVKDDESAGSRRKCLDCTGQGVTGFEPEEIATGLSEPDARTLAFGGPLIRKLLDRLEREGSGAKETWEAVDAARYFLQSLEQS